MVRFDVEDVEDNRVRYSEIVTDHKPSYEDVASMLIRTRYSMDAEFAIQRQRDSKPEAFAEYDAFCEYCKTEARQVMEG